MTFKINIVGDSGKTKLPGHIIVQYIIYSCPSVSNGRSAETDLTLRHKMLYLWLLSF